MPIDELGLVERTTGQKAAAFAVEALRIAFDGGTMDGDDIQELAVKHGLLIRVEFDPKKHDGEGAEYCEPGDPWYTFSRGLLLSDRARRLRARQALQDSK